MGDRDSPPREIRLPRSFVEEIENELGRAQRQLGAQRDRVQQLQTLYRMSLALEARLDKTVTVFDLIYAAEGPAELAHRQRLIEVLRPGRPVSRRPRDRPAGL